MTATWILNWWNLIFIVPFFLALVYLGVYTLSGWTFGDDFDSDHAVEADHHVAVEHDVNVDLDADADAHADHDADHHADAHDGSWSPAMALMLWLGVGRVPLGLVLIVLLLSWGFIGFITNNLVRPAMPADWMVGLISLPAALLGSSWITRTVTRLIARYMPLMETSAKRHDALLGHVGQAMYAIDNNFGMVSVRDKTAGTMQVPCRLGADHKLVARGGAVLLVGYDARDGLYTVIPYELTSELMGQRTGELSGERSGDARSNALTSGNANGKTRQL